MGPRNRGIQVRIACGPSVGGWSSLGRGQLNGRDEHQTTGVSLIGRLAGILAGQSIQPISNNPSVPPGVPVICHITYRQCLLGIYIQMRSKIDYYYYSNFQKKSRSAFVLFFESNCLKLVFMTEICFRLCRIQTQSSICISFHFLKMLNEFLRTDSLSESLRYLLEKTLQRILRPISDV